MRVLDLADIPEMPSYFDISATERRLALSFLYGYARDLAELVARGSRHPIDYVPTQAFTEHVRFELKLADETRVDGIRYRSSINDEPCYVVF